MAPALALISLVSPTLGNTVGVLLLGLVGASLIFGMTTLQAYWYHKAFPNDSLLHKCAVSILWLGDALHQCLIIHATYTYMVQGFGNTNQLDVILWSIKLQTTLNVCIILIVHSLYAMRVWRLSGYHNGVLGYLVASVVVAGFIIGVVFAYSIYTIKSFSGLDKIAWVINAAMAASTAIDFVISAAMWYYLRKSKGSQTNLNSRITTIMQYSLISGLFTSSFSLAALFTYILLPNTFVFLSIEFLVTKLYVVSFITMLNARGEWKKYSHGDTYDRQSNTNPSWRRSGWDYMPNTPNTVSGRNPHTTSSFYSPGPAQSIIRLEIDDSTRPPSPDLPSKPPTSFYAI